MDHDGWGGWPEDEPGDTADLGGSGSGLGESDAGLGDLAGHGEFDHDLGNDHDQGGFDSGGAWLPGEDDPFGAGPDAAAGHSGEPLPDDTFGGEADGFDTDGPGAGDGGDAHPAFLGVDPADSGHAEPGPPVEAPDASAPDAGSPDAGADHDGYDDAFTAAEHLVGTDPDVDPHLDDPGWHDSAFPPPLGLEQVPEPSDGFPWSDPDLLGEAAGASIVDFEAAWDPPAVGDLFEYAGLPAPAGGDAWGLLLASDDPATSALARWWAPGG